jgi:hypothetical protein
MRSRATVRSRHILPKPEQYRCTLSDGEGFTDKRREVGRRLLTPHPQWSDSAKVKASEKLYVVMRRLDGGSEFVYVGRTDSPIGVRMYRGLNARDYRYQWRDLTRVDLYVCSLAGLPEKDGEAVEAEFVYLIRRYQSRWPSHQNEIHFRHRLGVVKPELRQHAQDLYAHLVMRSCPSDC